MQPGGPAARRPRPARGRCAPAHPMGRPRPVPGGGPAVRCPPSRWCCPAGPGAGGAHVGQGPAGAGPFRVPPMAGTPRRRRSRRQTIRGAGGQGAPGRTEGEEEAPAEPRCASGRDRTMRDGAPKPGRLSASGPTRRGKDAQNRQGEDARTIEPPADGSGPDTHTGSRETITGRPGGRRRPPTGRRGPPAVPSVAPDPARYPARPRWECPPALGRGWEGRPGRC